jgi:hypothetical protein
MKINVDRFNVQAKEWHDKCRIVVDVNGQRERCGCSCNTNTLPTFNVIANLQGEDAETFAKYDDKELDEKEIESLKRAHELYKRSSS